MAEIVIYSDRYGIDIGGIVGHRLKCSKCNFTLSDSSPECIKIILDSKNSSAFFHGLTEVLLYDLVQFELADMINELSFNLAFKTELLKSSLGYARQEAIRAPVRNSLKEYFSHHNKISLDGFIDFRMSDTVDIWERSIERAAEDLFLLEQQYELTTLICELADLCIEPSINVVLILRRGGKCTLIDEAGTQIDYPDMLGIISILHSISPEIIKIYDLSDNEGAELIRAVKRDFPGRVRVYSSL